MASSSWLALRFEVCLDPRAPTLEALKPQALHHPIPMTTLVRTLLGTLPEPLCNNPYRTRTVALGPKP